MFRALIFISYPLDAAALAAAGWLWHRLRRERSVNARRAAWQRKVRDWQVKDTVWVIR